MRRAMNPTTIARFGLGVFLTLTVGARASAQAPAASDGWVELASPGETSARAFAVVRNPTMYDIYLVSATAEIAGNVEFRKTSNGESKTMREITVPAYGNISMEPDGVHLMLVDLKRPLHKGDTVPITLTTDGNAELRVDAIVRKE